MAHIDGTLRRRILEYGLEQKMGYFEGLPSHYDPSDIEVVVLPAVAALWDPLTHSEKLFEELMRRENIDRSIPDSEYADYPLSNAVRAWLDHTFESLEREALVPADLTKAGYNEALHHIYRGDESCKFKDWILDRFKSADKLSHDLVFISSAGGITGFRVGGYVIGAFHTYQPTFDHVGTQGRPLAWSDLADLICMDATTTGTEHMTFCSGHNISAQSDVPAMLDFALFKPMNGRADHDHPIMRSRGQDLYEGKPIYAQMIDMDHYCSSIDRQTGWGECKVLVVEGVISDARETESDYILTTIPVRGGNSGSPVFDHDGFLIGIIVASDRSLEAGQDKRGLGFVLPIRQVLTTLYQYHLAHDF